MNLWILVKEKDWNSIIETQLISRIQVKNFLVIYQILLSSGEDNYENFHEDIRNETDSQIENWLII